MELSVKTRKNKTDLYLDGEFLFTVPSVIWYSSRFREGDEVEKEELLSLKEEGDSSMAFDSAMRMLSLRAHSEYELRTKLKMKFSENAVDFAVEKLFSLELLDDEKFSHLLAEELYERKGFAPKRIVLELKNRGINSETAQNAVNALDIDKKIGIIKVIEKMKITESSTPKEKDRAIRRLINMGYSYSEISDYISIYE